MRQAFAESFEATAEFQNVCISFRLHVKYQPFCAIHSSDDLGSTILHPDLGQVPKADPGADHQIQQLFHIPEAIIYEVGRPGFPAKASQDVCTSHQMYEIGQFKAGDW